MTPPPPRTLRERTRRAVHSELVDVALELFARDGYDAVTVDQVAAAAGMSRRSLFRYFSSKDALILGKFERQGEQLAQALRERPEGEPAWVALRRMFDASVTYVSDPELGRRTAELMRVVNESSTLRAGYLEKMERAQHLVAEALHDREQGRMTLLDAAALTAAAFAAISVANSHARATDGDLADALDAAMNAIGAADASAG